MAGKKKHPGPKAKDLRKPRKKKVSPIVKDKIEYIDYKDVNLLRAFVSDRSKIRSQRVSGNNRHQQREVAKAIKVAREMALIPYAQRVVTQRKGDRRRGRSDRDARNEDFVEEVISDEIVEEVISDEITDDFVEVPDETDETDEVSEVVSSE